MAAVVLLAPRLTVNVVPLMLEMVICSLPIVMVLPLVSPETLPTETEVAVVSVIALDRVVATEVEEVISMVVEVLVAVSLIVKVPALTPNSLRDFAPVIPWLKLS